MVVTCADLIKELENLTLKAASTSKEMDTNPTTGKDSSEKETILETVRREMTKQGLDPSLGRLDELFAKMKMREIPGGRGWYIFGNTGTGKTARAKIAAKLTGIELVDACEYSWEVIRTLTRDFDLMKACRLRQNLDGYVVGNPLIIDDLGTEPNEVNIFGTKVNPMQFILERRMNHWPKVKTYITSNLTRADLGRRYGERTLSRFEGAMIFIPLVGKDWRKDS